jgi:TonB family protein
MKKYFLLTSLFSYLIINADSQELKKISEESGDKYSKIKETFEVLKSDKSIRQGSYEKYRRDKLQTTGFYNKNEKDSTWIEYSNGTTIAIRHYKNGARTGEWEFYNFKTELELKYNIEEDSVTFIKEKDSTNKIIKPDSSKTALPTDSAIRFQFSDADGNWKKIPSGSRFPMNLFSSGEFARFLNVTLRYPDDAVNNEIQGVIWIGVIIDENGHAIDYTFEKTVHKSLDDEAMRVVKLFHPEYIPAIVNGKKVKSKIIQPIQFKIANE